MARPRIMQQHAAHVQQKHAPPPYDKQWGYLEKCECAPGLMTFSHSNKRAVERARKKNKQTYVHGRLDDTQRRALAFICLSVAQSSRRWFVFVFRYGSLGALDDEVYTDVGTQRETNIIISQRLGWVEICVCVCFVCVCWQEVFVPVKMMMMMMMPIILHEHHVATKKTSPDASQTIADWHESGLCAIIIINYELVQRAALVFCNIVFTVSMSMCRDIRDSTLLFSLRY